MINSFKMFVLNEAISLKNAKKKKLNRANSGAYGNEKLDDVFNGKDRLIFPIDVKIEAEETPLLQTLNSFLSFQLQITKEIHDIEDYIKGITYGINDIHNKNPLKIGRILNKIIENKDKKYNEYVVSRAITYLKAFKEDPIRQKQKRDYFVVISRHPYDVAGMSTDRSWGSCMNLGLGPLVYNTTHSNSEGRYNRYVKNDIKQGTIVAYLVSGSDRHSNGKLAVRRPLSRTLMKPHSSSSYDTAYSIGNIYGSDIGEFKEFVKDWILENLNKDIDKNSNYSLEKGLYYDGDEPVMFSVSGSKKHLMDLFLSHAYIDNKDIGNVNVDGYYHNNGYYGIEYNLVFENMECSFSFDYNVDLNSVSFFRRHPIVGELLNCMHSSTAFRGITYNKEDKRLIVYYESEGEFGFNDKIYNMEDSLSDFMENELSISRLDYSTIKNCLKNKLKKLVDYDKTEKERFQTELEKVDNIISGFSDSYKKLTKEVLESYEDYYVPLLNKHGYLGFLNMIDEEQKDKIRAVNHNMNVLKNYYNNIIIGRINSIPVDRNIISQVKIHDIISDAVNEYLDIETLNKIYKYSTLFRTYQAIREIGITAPLAHIVADHENMDFVEGFLGGNQWIPTLSKHKGLI